LSARRSSIPDAALAGAAAAAVAKVLGAGSPVVAIGAGCAIASGPARAVSMASGCARDRFA
jgi:hypothetical protein